MDYNRPFLRTVNVDHDRLSKLERQLDELLRGNIEVAARANGSEIVTDGSPAARAMRVVLSELRKDVPYDSCSVQALRDRRLVIIGGVGFADLDVLLGESFDIDSLDVPNGEVVHRRRPLVVQDTDLYRAFRRGLHVGAGVRSWLGVPLIDDDRVIGMLALDKAEPDFYTSEHAQKALEFATILARTLEDHSDSGARAG